MGSFLKLTVLLLMCAAFAPQVHGQISVSRLIREGDLYYEQGQYRSALKYYQEAGNPDTWKKGTALRVGVCQFEINRIDESIQTLNILEEADKTEEEVYLYLAKAHQHKNQYESAIRFYKEYIRKAKKPAETIAWAKDEIKRCARGLHLKYGEETAFIENLGVVVNTLNDEVCPVSSPTIRDRLYFASNRAGSMGVRQLADGMPDSKFGELPYDIYFTRKNTGSWQQPEPMPGAFNTMQHDLILDFSLDGQVGYFFQSDRLHAGQIIADTFSVRADGNARQGSFRGPMRPEYGDTDLRMFKDSIMLFSSARPGGYGGYDLYICVRRFGIWQTPMNLGPDINSFYHERHPYLALNGRVLFFSSNSLESIGGMDIFRSDYDDQSARWGIRRNLGLPVNSPADELHFELSADGSTAFMSSDRKSGYGGFDLYSIYFKKQVRENLEISSPLTFYQHAESKARTPTEEESQQPAIMAGKPGEEKEFYISDLYYGEDDIIVSPQNIKKLDLMANMMLIYPQLTLELVCHELSDGRPAFSLYFSIKKAEKALGYLVDKGVAPDRITIRGAGGYFPLEISGLVSPLVMKLNRRISVRFHQEGNEPVKIYREKQVLPDGVDETKLYAALTEGLCYMVQIAATSQMLQAPLLDTRDYAMIEYDPGRKLYRYLVSLSKTYSEAKPTLEYLRQNGFGDAFIVPFIGGERIDRDEVLKYSEQYPDLLNLFR